MTHDEQHQRNAADGGPESLLGHRLGLAWRRQPFDRGLPVWRRGHVRRVHPALASGDPQQKVGPGTRGRLGISSKERDGEFLEA